MKTSLGIFSLIAAALVMTGCTTATPAPTVTEITQSTPVSSPTAAMLSFEKSTQEFTARESFQAGLGDLDGDGDLDAVFANPQQNNSQVWLNDGNGHLIDTGQKLTQYGHGVSLGISIKTATSTRSSSVTNSLPRARYISTTALAPCQKAVRI